MRFLLLRLALLVLFLTLPIDSRRSEQAATDYDEISANRADLEKKSSMGDIVEAKALVGGGEKPESAMIANQTNLSYYDFSGKINRYKRSIEVMKKEMMNAEKEIAEKGKELAKASKNFTEADESFLNLETYNAKIAPYNEARRNFELADSTHERLNKEYAELKTRYDKVINKKKDALRKLAEAYLTLDEWSFLNDIKEETDAKVKKQKVQTFLAKHKSLAEDLGNLKKAKDEYDQLESCIKDPVNIAEVIPVECKKKWEEVKFIENKLKENKYLEIETLSTQIIKIERWLVPAKLNDAVTQATQRSGSAPPALESEANDKWREAKKEVNKADNKVVEKWPNLREIYHKELEVWKWRIEKMKKQEEMKQMMVEGDKPEYERPRRMRAEIEGLKRHVKSMEGLIGMKEAAMKNAKGMFEKRKDKLEEAFPHALHFSFYGCVGLLLLLPVIIISIIVLCTRRLTARGPPHWGKFYVKLRKRNFRRLHTKERAFQGKKVGRRCFYPLWPWEIANAMKFKLNATKTRATYKRFKINWERGFFGIDRTGPNPYHFDPLDPPRITWDPPERREPKENGQEIEENEKNLRPVYPLKSRGYNVEEKEFRSWYYFHLHARHNRRAKARVKYRLFLHKAAHKKLYQGKPHKTAEKHMKEKEEEALRKNEKEGKKERKREKKKEWMKEMKWEKTTMRRDPEGKVIKMPRKCPVNHKNFTKMLYVKYQMELYKMMHGEHHSYLLRKAKKRHRKHAREEKAHSGCSPQSAKRKHRKRYKMKGRHGKRAKKNAKSVKEEGREEGKGEDVRRKSPKRAKRRVSTREIPEGPEAKIPDAVDKEDSTKGKPEAAPVLILPDDPREQKTQENTRALSAFGVPYLEEDKTQPATAKTGLMGDTDQRLRRQKQIIKTGEDDETQATKTGPYFDAKSSLAGGGGKKSQMTQMTQMDRKV